MVRRQICLLIQFLVGVEIISNLNNIVSRNISPFANVVISIGEFNSGKTSNVIPNDARIQADCEN